MKSVSLKLQFWHLIAWNLEIKCHGSVIYFQTAQGHNGCIALQAAAHSRTGMSSLVNCCHNSSLCKCFLHVYKSMAFVMGFFYPRESFMKGLTFVNQCCHTCIDGNATRLLQLHMVCTIQALSFGVMSSFIKHCLHAFIRGRAHITKGTVYTVNIPLFLASRRHSVQTRYAQNLYFMCYRTVNLQ